MNNNIFKTPGSVYRKVNFVSISIVHPRIHQALPQLQGPSLGHTRGQLGKEYECLSEVEFYGQVAQVRPSCFDLDAKEGVNAGKEEKIYGKQQVQTCSNGCA